LDNNMTDTYKVLGQALTGELALDGTTVKETVVYQVPAGTKASVSAIEITNSDVSSQTYKVAFVPSDDVASAVSNVEYPDPNGYTANRFTALAYNGGSLYSDDGITWVATNAPEYQWTSIAFGDKKFVAIAANSNVAAYSTDGITWTETNLPASVRWLTVTYGNGKFVAVSQDDGSAYSTDGITWTYVPFVTNFWSVTYGNGKFVAVPAGSNAAAYSENGITWTLSTLPYTEIWFALSFGNGKFVSVASGTSLAAYSTDGITWTASSMPSSREWWALTYGDGKFVAVGVGINATAYSTDGINWTQSTMPSNSAWLSITFGNGKFVSVASGTNKVAYSTDGITWEEASNLLLNRSWEALGFGYVDTTQTFQQSIPQSLNKHIAVYNKSIAPGETHEIKGGVTLSAGDQIRVYSTSNEIITNVYGVEIA
jgi:hypothetical protein